MTCWWEGHFSPHSVFSQGIQRNNLVSPYFSPFFFYTQTFWSHFEIMLECSKNLKKKSESNNFHFYPQKKKTQFSSLIIHLKVQTFIFMILIINSGIFVLCSQNSLLILLLVQIMLNKVCSSKNFLSVYCKNWNASYCDKHNGF